MIRPSLAESGYRCVECGFELWTPIAPVGICHLGLYDDARFPGRCLLVLDEHFEDLATLDPGRSRRFLADAQRAARAIATVVKPTRVNYAVLGNAVPHLHFHLIPRFAEQESAPNRSPWNDERPHACLPDAERVALVRSIREALDRT